MFTKFRFPTRTDVAICAAIAAVVLAIMLPSFRWTLLNDDYYHVARAVRLWKQGGALGPFVGSQSGSEDDEYGWSRAAIRSDYYRPVVDLSFAIDHSIYGLRQPGYRLTNFLVYLGAAVAVYWLGLLLLGSRAVAATGSLLFVVNAEHFSPMVGQIAGRTDSLVGFLGLLGVAAFVHHRQTRRLISGAFSGALVVAAVFTKETGLGVPLVCIAYDLLYTRPLDRRKATFHAVTLSLTGVYLFARITMFEGVGRTQVAIPTTVGHLTDIAMMIPRSLGMTWDGLIPGVPLTAELALSWILLLLGGVAYVRSVREGPATIRFASFCVLAFYIMAGPFVLYQPPPTNRYLLMASGFASLLVAHMVVNIAVIRPPTRITSLMGYTLAALICAPIVGRGVRAFAPVWIEGDHEASVVVQRVLTDLESELNGLAPGTRIFILVAPAWCGRHGVFYNGLQDWVRLRYERRLEPYVVSGVGYEDCRKIPGLEVDQIEPNRFRLRLPQSEGIDQFVLSQADLWAIPAGDSIMCRYCSVKVETRSRHPRYQRTMATTIVITLPQDGPEPRDGDLILAHDGERLWRYEYESEPAAPL